MTCALELVNYLHMIHYIGFVGAQFLNFLLIFLIMTKSGKILGNYRYAMLVFTLCSMIYSTVEILVMPVAHMKGSMFVVFMHSNLPILPVVLRQFFTCLHCVLSGFVASLLACQFLYRYLVLCRTHLLVHLQGKRLARIFLPSVFVFTVWHLGFFHGMPNTPEKQLYLQEELSSCFHVDSHSVAFVGPMYWSETADGVLVWHPVDVVAAVSCTATLIGCFVTIVVCALCIYKKMKKSKSHLSKKTLDVNKQLFKMLSIQTVIPMITMYTPVALFVSLPAIGKDIPYLGNLTSSSLAVYPFIEPLIAITVITSFRRAILGFIGCHPVPRSRKFAVHISSATRISGHAFPS